MRENLNPEIVYNEYKLGVLEKELAFKFLIDFIENSNDQSTRIQSLGFLQNIEGYRTISYLHKKYKDGLI